MNQSSPNDQKPGPISAVAADESRGFLGWLKRLIAPEGEQSLRETIGEYISETDGAQEDPVSRHERLLLANILKLRDMTVVNVMIPRANIFAIDANTTGQELLNLLAKKQYSRIPVYRGTLDDVLGTIHIKDILSVLAKGQQIDIISLIRESPVVSPAMPVLDLLLTMRKSKRHMALVVDEFGGIDGLVTVNDVLEAIVGEIEDEHNAASSALRIKSDADGSVTVDARLSVEEFEKKFGPVFREEEREQADTINGAVFAMEGRIPARGEVLTHGSGMIFEILDADPRRVNTLRIRNIPRR